MILERAFDCSARVVQDKLECRALIGKLQGVGDRENCRT